MKVVKRDGKVKEFDSFKITAAIKAANDEVKVFEEMSPQDIDRIAEIVVNKSLRLSGDRISVEQIQDLVEDTLLKSRFNKTAKAYILYREQRTQKRGNSTDKTFLEFLSGQNEYWNTENSNKDATVVTTQRDYLAGIAGTDLARRFLLPKAVCDAHDAGIIHQHDMDYMAEKARNNCCLVNLEDMLQHGTVLNGIKIDPQNRLLTATTVATQIITAVSSSQYGGVTITLAHLAPYVRKSANFYINEVTDELKDLPLTDTQRGKMILEIAEKRLMKEIKDAVQTFNYQINSMSSTNGQAPFISVNMHISEDPEYRAENALLIEEFLKQRILGLKNPQGVYITPAFPKLLYVLDEDNTYEGSEFFEITKLAAKCTAKRMVPDYISAKKMREYKGDVYPCMGCRSFLTPDRTKENYAKACNWQPDKSKYYGRFNMGVTTINLVDAAFSSNGNEDKFWKLLEERCELCHLGLRARIDRLLEVTADVAPILWRYGAFARLDYGEKLTDLIYNGYSTASLGYAGLYECVKYMKGVSHTDPAGKEFAKRVMQKLNDMCAKWKAAENIDYSVYGSPIESTTYKFAKKLKARFGDDIFVKLDGKDRNYITNSYHVPVFEEIDAFEKLAIEAEFQPLSPGGAISYVETADLTGNTEAVISVIQFIYENIMYAELNTKSDYCQVCHYDGEMQISEDMKWYCPNCGNADEKRLNVARRTCGYIGVNKWGYGRTQEIKERVIHLGAE
jgi:ribonucleoside-triphosphate reductase